MALITCPECGHDVSDRATTCPHCGYPMTETFPQIVNNNDSQGIIAPPKKKNILPRLLIGLFVVILVAAFVFFRIYGLGVNDGKLADIYNVVGKGQEQYFELNPTNLLSKLNSNLSNSELSLSVTQNLRDSDTTTVYSASNATRVMVVTHLNNKSAEWKRYISQIEFKLYPADPKNTPKNDDYINALIASFTPGREKEIVDALGINGAPNKEAKVYKDLYQVQTETVAYSFVPSQSTFYIQPYNTKSSKSVPPPQPVSAIVASNVKEFPLKHDETIDSLNETLSARGYAKLSAPIVAPGNTEALGQHTAFTYSLGAGASFVLYVNDSTENILNFTVLTIATEISTDTMNYVQLLIGSLEGGIAGDDATTIDSELNLSNTSEDAFTMASTDFAEFMYMVQDGSLVFTITPA